MYPARDIPAPHKTWDNPPLVSSEPTADHAVARRTCRPLAARRLTRRELLSQRARCHPRYPLSDHLTRSKPALTGNEYGEACLPTAASRSTVSVVTMGRTVMGRSARRTAALRAIIYWASRGLAQAL
jgi:hypothetical protein